MKLVKQVQLAFRQGSSDKVYEVDLCEVGSNQFVVNFRYGKRGAALKDGSKTALPVSREEAEVIFDKLVRSKTAKGYKEAGGKSGAPEKKTARKLPEVEVPDTGNVRHTAVLRRLAQGKAEGSSWPLERAVWRAGELAIAEALPYLLKEAKLSGALGSYCTAFALGRAGRAAQEKDPEGASAHLEKAVQYLEGVYGKTPGEPQGRMAAEALLLLYSDAEREGLRAEILKELPGNLAASAGKGPREQFNQELTEYLGKGSPETCPVLDQLYLLDNEHVRPALLEILRTAPLKPNFFRSLRHIFKAAEFRRDAEALGILAARFDQVKFNYYIASHYDRNSDYGPYVRAGGSYIRANAAAKRKPDTKLSYSSRTREYLRRRVWRFLRRLGRDKDGDFARIAARILLNFTDAHAKKPRTYTYYTYSGGYKRKHIYYDSFSEYHVLNSILYSNSSRYLHNGRLKWKCAGKYKPGEEPPEKREEAFPEVWDRAPEILVSLLEKSDCEPVHHFASLALRQGNAEYLENIGPVQAIRFLGRPYPGTVRLGMEAAERLHDPAAPDLELILAASLAALADVREKGLKWLDASRSELLGDGVSLARLALSPWEDVTEYCRKLLSSSELDTEVAWEFIGKATAHLIGLKKKDAEEAARIVSLLLFGVENRLRTVGPEVIRDLLKSPLPEVQELAGQILLKRDEPPEESLVLGLIESNFDIIRGIGVRLLGRFSDEDLLERRELLVSLSRRKWPEVRNAARPIVVRLASLNVAFAEAVLADFIRALLGKANDDIHAHLVAVIRDDLREILDGLSETLRTDLAWQLLNAKSGATQELGGILLQRLNPGNFETPRIVKLSSHEIKSVREASWTWYRSLIPRLKTEMPQAVKMLESTWEDTREFAFDFFRENFGDEDYTAETLVSICDSVDERVRQFGREMIVKMFRNEDGETYMLKFSEHPSPDMQTFVTNYLDRYARDNPEKLRGMRHFFIAVLSLVNRGRLARDRIFTFLEEESLKHRESAELTRDIMERISATIAVGDRARALGILLNIARAHPDLESPLKIRAPERHPAFAGEYAGGV